MTTPKFCLSQKAAFPGISRVVLLGLIFSLLGVPLSSQATGGGSGEDQTKHPFTAIVGTVWGPDGVPRYGVTVKIRRADDKNPKKARWEVYSDHRGEFDQRVPLTTADYILWADLKGYKGQDRKKLQPGDEVKVHVENNPDQRIQIDTGLHLK
ncbi:MAG TPA: hypothetical protein VH079_01260 [Terriglobales bacterium]|nr:hypothetical protein [Terriglobales bacterium]